MSDLLRLLDGLGLGGGLMCLGGVSIAVLLLMQVAAGDTHTGGDSGISPLYYLAALGLVGMGICIAVGS